MVYNIAIDLNFPVLVVAFLCFEKPIVIKITATIFMNGCSIAYNLKFESFIISPIDIVKTFTFGETKYKINPTNN